MEDNFISSSCWEHLPLLISNPGAGVHVAFEHVDQSVLGLVWGLQSAEAHVCPEIAHVSSQCSVPFKIEGTFFPGGVSLSKGRVHHERKSGDRLPTEPRDLDRLGRSLSSMASSLMNSRKKYWLVFLESWYRTNQSATWHLESTYSRHLVTSSSYLCRI